jgi:hypothetical protein
MAVDSIDGWQAVTYMLLSIEAKLNAQAELLIEVTDILTQKKPGQVKNEYTLNAIKQHREVLKKMIDDKTTIEAIKKMM